MATGGEFLVAAVNALAALCEAHGLEGATDRIERWLDRVDP
ncbi:MAG TPA: hypothetical protein VFD31_03460 [Thermoleophilaceae bacterium]|nr:hypothetical protein [Thermoleophilaceae bacterium]